MKIFAYLVLGCIPGIFWVWYYLRKDREKPEPIGLIVKVFLFGMAITIPAIAFEFGLDYFFNFSGEVGIMSIIFSSLIIVAPVEELLKYVVVREVVYKDPHFDEPIDGVVYMVVAALGFATLENLLVVFAGGGSIIFLRFATATLMHALASGIIGYYMGISMVYPQKRTIYLVEGVVVAVILHALYNITISLNDNLVLTLVLVGSILAVMFVILSRGMSELKRLEKERNGSFAKT